MSEGESRVSPQVMKEIENERKVSEPEGLWQLRKEFLTRNWDDMEKDRVCCLSMVFQNMESMGNDYPAPVKEEVQRLAAGIRTGLSTWETKEKDMEKVRQEKKQNKKRRSM